MADAFGILSAAIRRKMIRDGSEQMIEETGEPNNWAAESQRRRRPNHAGTAA